MKLNVLINAFKLSTGFFIMGLMLCYNNYGIPAYLYLAMHGSYGILWTGKEWVCPDMSFHREETPIMLIASSIYLCNYWVAPTLLIRSNVEAHPYQMAIAVFLYTVGTYLHIGADTQKYYCLKNKGKHLIATGFFSLIRNPNYLGEFFIYSSFAYLTQHWLPWMILFFNMATFWFPQMYKKDLSLSRYPEWPQYSQKTYLFFPWVL